MPTAGYSTSSYQGQFHDSHGWIYVIKFFFVFTLIMFRFYIAIIGFSLFKHYHSSPADCKYIVCILCIKDGRGVFYIWVAFLMYSVLRTCGFLRGFLFIHMYVNFDYAILNLLIVFLLPTISSYLCIVIFYYCGILSLC